MPRIKRDIDTSNILWTLGTAAAVAAVMLAVVFAPLVALSLLAGAFFLWTFRWNVHTFFAFHFSLAVGSLMAVPILRLTSAENSLRMAVPAIIVATALAVAVRIRGSRTPGLAPLLLVFFVLSFIATSFVQDPNEWSFFAVEASVAFAAVMFAKAAAKIHAWPTVARIIILATAAEAALGIYEVFRLTSPIWRGGRILPDGTSTWIRNEVVASMPRAQGTFGHPLPFAFTLIIGALLVLRTKLWPGPIRFALFCLMGAGVFVSGSRNAIILFVALSVVAFILPSLIPRLHVIGTMAVVGVALAFPFLLGKFDELLGSGSVDHRLGALAAVSNLTTYRNFAVVMLGDGSASTPRLFTLGLLQNDGFAAVDNQYVLTLAQNGIVGLLILVTILWIAMRRGSATLRLMLLGVIITGMIFDLFAWPVIGFVVWFLIASAFACMPDTNPPPKGRDVLADSSAGPGPWKQSLIVSKNGNGLARSR